METGAVQCFRFSCGALGCPARVYSTSGVHSIFAGGVRMEKQEYDRPEGRKPPEICVTIHYAPEGPSLASQMVSILNAHLSRDGNC